MGASVMLGTVTAIFISFFSKESTADPILQTNNLMFLGVQTPSEIAGQ